MMKVIPALTIVVVICTNNIFASCPRIQTIENGFVEGNGYLEGDTLSFRCKGYYVLEGERVITCTGKGRWSYEAPTCKAPCPPLPQPLNGYEYSTSRKHGSYVLFGCAYGHRLVGSSRMKCNDGKWSEPMPRCLAICIPIERIKNGWVDGGGNLKGDTLSFRCRTDYVLEGENRLICIGYLRWNHKKPRCKAPCARISSPAHGRIIKQGFRHNEDIEFECDRDYYLRGTNLLTCTDGMWNADPPTCSAPCPRLPEIRNGNINGDKSLTHGSVAIFSCNDGYQHVGPIISQCLNGKWTQEQLRCLQKCSDPSAKTNAMVVGNALFDGQEVEFVCPKKDFVLYPPRSSKLLCQDGDWSGTIPSCKAPCARLRPPDHGRIIRQGFRHDENIQFECDKDYDLNGRRTLTCSNGKWSDAPPVCLARTVPTTNLRTSASTTQISTPAKPKLCQEIPSTGKIIIKGYGLSLGSKRSFSCSFPKIWEISGAKEITCLDNGQWNAPSPTCKVKGPVIDCPILKKIKGGFATRNESFHGGRVVFECNQNYVMTGKKGTLCKSGKWLRSAPKCLAPCRNLRAPLMVLSKRHLATNMEESLRLNVDKVTPSWDLPQLNAIMGLGMTPCLFVQENKLIL